MGVRALPTVASQVTPSQADAILDDDVIVPETEILSDDDVISDTAADIYTTDEEATQPPTLTPIVTRDLRQIPERNVVTFR